MTKTDMAHTQTVALTAPRTTQTSGYILAALGAVLFSTKGIIIKLAYGDGGQPEVDAITLLTLRMMFSLPFYVIVGVMAWRSHRQEGRALPSFKLMAGAGALGIVCFHFSAYVDFEGLVYLSAQFERLILFTYPVFVMLLGALFFGGRITAWGVMTMLISYAGIAVIFASGATARGEHVVLGVALVLGAAFMYSYYQLAARILLKAMGNRVFTSVAMSVASVTIFAHFLAAGHAGRLLNVSPRVLWLSCLMAVVSTVLPSFMINAALERIGAQAVSVIGTVSPVATIFMAVLLVGEAFTPTDALGTALVIGGVGLYTWYDSRQKRVVPLAPSPE